MPRAVILAVKIETEVNLSLIIGAGGLPGKSLRGVQRG